MPPRLAFKPDESFFQKIAIGAIGARAVAASLDSYGHQIAELEGGATDTKLWKDVKRKRVRIPDLVCVKCGCRFESRAKSQPTLSMSHSPSVAERAWDYGMVDNDIIAFPVCQSVVEENWSAGRLGNRRSYWHKRERLRWEPPAYINYFRAGDFRAVHASASSTKGVTEGSETSLTWDAVFSTRRGQVEAVGGKRISIRRESDGHLYTWQNEGQLPVHVAPGEGVAEFQVIASKVPPIPHRLLQCPGTLPANHITHLLASPERTQRFTGVKLARLRAEPNFSDDVRNIVAHPEEDVYVRLEGSAYLASVCSKSARELFGAFLNSSDEQIQLEAVVALANARTIEAQELLSGLLDTPQAPFFLRSAAAWALGKIGGDIAIGSLMRAFADVDHSVREEALEAVSVIGGPALDQLLVGLNGENMDIAAGSAEALRRYEIVPPEAVRRLVRTVNADSRHVWAVWLLSHLPRSQDYVAAAVAELQDTNPAAHYTISVLWAFVQSWVARHWELYPGAQLPEGGGR